MNAHVAKVLIAALSVAGAASTAFAADAVRRIGAVEADLEAVRIGLVAVVCRDTTRPADCRAMQAALARRRE